MGAPSVSIARLTISIARSTPAQKPRGLASTMSISTPPSRQLTPGRMAQAEPDHQHGADHDAAVGHVEHRPVEVAPVPLHEVHHVAEADPVDDVADGAGDDQGERERGAPV